MTAFKSEAIDDIPQESSASAKVGVMLVNLGTPDALDRASIRRYLGEFLSDRRVIELHPLFWWPILFGLVLPLRSRRVVEAYGKIWHVETDESPLRRYSRIQAERIGSALQARDERLIVDWAMRYGSPSIPEVLDRLILQGCRRIMVVPLYPQYSATTTATVNDKVFASLKKMRVQPAIRILPPYYGNPSYIEAIGCSIEDYFEQAGGRPEVLIASFHGLPQSYIDAGDPYRRHCQETTCRLRERLRVDDQFLRMTFQSRFGPKQWLQPYTSATLTELATSGVKHVAVITPGFSVDCLETLEEIALQNRDLFLEHGGRRFDYIPCLNDSNAGLKMLESLILNELAGWVEPQ